MGGVAIWETVVSRHLRNDDPFTPRDTTPIWRIAPPHRTAPDETLRPSNCLRAGGCSDWRGAPRKVRAHRHRACHIGHLRNARIADVALREAVPGGRVESQRSPRPIAARCIKDHKIVGVCAAVPEVVAAPDSRPVRLPDPLGIQFCVVVRVATSRSFLEDAKTLCNQRNHR
jgi:hypothetical protein